jgi:ribosome biogenesis GTPase A
MTWPNVSPAVGLKLAATHSIGRNAYDEETVALDLAGYLLDDYPDRITRRYGELPARADGHAVLDAIACARKLVVKGGGPDLRKAGSVLLQEFRDGVLGRISLETVAQVAERPVAG